jgi:hypothetical protein
MTRLDWQVLGVLVALGVAGVGMLRVAARLRAVVS